MLLDGKIMLSYQPLETLNLPNFFRIVFINPDLEEKDLDNILKLVDGYR